MDDDDEFEVFVIGAERPSFKWDQSQMISDVLDLAAAMVELQSQFMRTLAVRAAADSNFTIDQQEFAAEAAKEIESISEGAGDTDA